MIDPKPTLNCLIIEHPTVSRAIQTQLARIENELGISIGSECMVSTPTSKEFEQFNVLIISEEINRQSEGLICVDAGIRHIPIIIASIDPKRSSTIPSDDVRLLDKRALLRAPSDVSQLQGILADYRLIIENILSHDSIVVGLPGQEFEHMALVI